MNLRVAEVQEDLLELPHAMLHWGTLLDFLSTWAGPGRISRCNPSPQNSPVPGKPENWKNHRDSVSVGCSPLLQENETAAPASAASTVVEPVLRAQVSHWAESHPPHKSLVRGYAAPHQTSAANIELVEQGQETSRTYFSSDTSPNTSEDHFKRDALIHVWIWHRMCPLARDCCPYTPMDSTESDVKVILLVLLAGWAW
ncbi:hypothetical protein Y1Q_0022505 [Alligator mississippiensis]|uniref:Uncharacterized protein n=1 Tax=Alligator mississippiensis TaxID=8496 RepID=A0A151M447_ALLMI|nr:hypothetical protein Y1Q_0022505 [Alligator mississippiensis]